MQLGKMWVVTCLAFSVIGCSPENPPVDNSYSGYIEAVHLYLAPSQSGWIEQLLVSEGKTVEQNELLVRLDDSSQQLLLTQAKASLAQAQQQLANLQQGSRDEELQLAQMKLHQQQILQQEAGKELSRQQQMFVDQLTSEANLDRAQANFDALSSQVAQLKQQLKVLNLPAREHVISAALQQVEVAKQALELQQWQVQQRVLYSRQRSTVDEIYYRQGEFVAQGVPILSMLVPDQFKVRFFIEQAKLSQLSVGQTVSVTNDAGQQVNGIISYIAKEPEFAPPVLYSINKRETLLFMVEAKIASNQYRPGQPVDVLL